MKLRWLVTCNKDGLKTEPTLQYWDSDFKQWRYIKLVEFKTSDVVGEDDEEYYDKKE